MIRCRKFGYAGDSKVFVRCDLPDSHEGQHTATRNYVWPDEDSA